MKIKKIVAKDIKSWHPFKKDYSSDQYYQRIANLLQDTFYTINIDVKDKTDEVFHESAILLTRYMEDIMADCGIWRMFSEQCQQLYGHPVPMYHEQEEYYPDEPSKNAVRFLIWSTISNITDEIVSTDGDAIERMATHAYDILNELFDEAPVNEQLAEDLTAFVKQSENGFDDMRAVLMWIYTDCYLTSGKRSEELLMKHTEDGLDMLNNEHTMASPGMAFFYAVTHCIFQYKTGPLALYAKDYLALLMRQRGMEELATDLEHMERIYAGIYKYEFIKEDRLLLTRTNGRQIEIQAEELNLKKKQLEEHDGCMASSFVYYQQEWHLNGILVPLEKTAEKWEKLCEDDPENLKPGTETLTADKMLKRTKGQRIAYFADREQMKDWLVEKIQFPRHMIGFVDEQGGEQPTIFIDTEEQKNCLQFFFGYNQCIADPSNPYYDKEEAKERAVNMLWNAESVTTHAMNYMLDMGFLPDIYRDMVFSRHNTTEQTRKDIDFLIRFWRQENY